MWEERREGEEEEERREGEEEEERREGRRGEEEEGGRGGRGGGRGEGGRREWCMHVRKVEEHLHFHLSQFKHFSL